MMGLNDFNFPKMYFFRILEHYEAQYLFLY